MPHILWNRRHLPSLVVWYCASFAAYIVGIGWRHLYNINIERSLKTFTTIQLSTIVLCCIRDSEKKQCSRLTNDFRRNIVNQYHKNNQRFWFHLMQIRKIYCRHCDWIGMKSKGKFTQNCEKLIKWILILQCNQTLWKQMSLFFDTIDSRLVVFRHWLRARIRHLDASN